MKRHMPVFLSALTLLTLSACATAPPASAAPASAAPASGAVASSAVASSAAASSAAPQAAESAVAITLGDPITVGGPGATVSGSTVTITAGGAYRVSGALADGQLVVQVADESPVTLILDGVRLSASAGPALAVLSGSPTVLILADGTGNVLSDGKTYSLAGAADEPDAALFAKGALTIAGSGALTVNGNYKHAIVSKDDLTLAGGAVTVTAVADGVRGRDSIVIREGTLTVTAGGDGLQANNDEDAAKGFISIEGGTVQVTAKDDGIQAEARSAWAPPLWVA
jgi:hypothetical protein